MPPDETPPADQIPVPSETPPAAPEIPADVASLVASLSPKNMGQGQKPAEPAPDAVKTDAPVVPPTQQQDRSAPLNFAELRKARDAAEKKVEDLTKELEEARKVKAPVDDADRKALADKLAAAEKEKADLYDTVSRVAVHKTPEYVEKQELINEAKKDIKAALDHPAVKDTLGRVSAKELTDAKKYNDVIRALTDAGEFAAVEDLKTALNVSRIWESELRTMEEASRQKNEAWTKNRLATASSRIAQTRANLTNVNPAIVPGSPEFLKHPPEVQKVIASAHSEAEKIALDVQSKSPEEQLDHLYASTLSSHLNMQQRAALENENKGLQTRLTELEQRLAAYEKTTPAPSIGSGGGGAASSAAELAARLSPRKMRPG